MNVIGPLRITAAALAATSVPNSPAPVWSAPVSYALGDQVRASGFEEGAYERVFESLVDGNSGHDPRAGDKTKWLELGATDRFKPFDLKIKDLVTATGSLSYTVTAPALVTGIALLGLQGTAVQVQITNQLGVETCNITRQLIDTTDVYDWHTYFTWDGEYDTEELFFDLPGYAGSQITVTVFGTATVALGQIVMGKHQQLGTTLDGTEIGIEDFSIKERDPFGNAVLIERAFAETVQFQFWMPTNNAARVRRALSRLRAAPAFYFAGQDLAHLGTSVFGFYQDMAIPLSSDGNSFATLEIEGLV
ncbi:hypothetical protein MHM39_14835 [Phaeobacter sp. CNT1-3]|nr:hypothetical protein [Phaeobacter sp. CNT1-3]